MEKENKSVETPVFVRVREASRLTNLPPATIYDKFHKGEIPGVQLGATVLISLAGIRALERRALGQSDE